MFIFLIKKGFVLFFPMEGNGHYRVIGILPYKKEEDETFTFEDIEEPIKEQMAISVSFEEVRWLKSQKNYLELPVTFISFCGLIIIFHILEKR